jgi:hypothetical protein
MLITGQPGILGDRPVRIWNYHQRRHASSIQVKSDGQALVLLEHLVSSRGLSIKANKMDSNCSYMPP